MEKNKEYYESLDKRTSEYKTWAKFNKLGNESKGLGDTVEKVLKATGIKKIVEVFTDGKDCGCDKRKEKLNDIFPHKRPAKRCLTEEMYNNYKLYIGIRDLSNMRDMSHLELITKIYAWVFALQYNPSDLSGCDGCNKIIININKELDIVFETYKRDLMDLKIK